LARADTKTIDTGDRFPDLEIKMLEGGTTKVPDDLTGKWSVFIIYRGLF